MEKCSNCEEKEAEYKLTLSDKEGTVIEIIELCVDCFDHNRYRTDIGVDGIAYLSQE